jgi:hypothetical protein
VAPRCPKVHGKALIRDAIQVLAHLSRPKGITLPCRHFDLLGPNFHQSMTGIDAIQGIGLVRQLQTPGNGHLKQADIPTQQPSLLRRRQPPYILRSGERRQQDTSDQQEGTTIHDFPP